MRLGFHLSIAGSLRRVVYQNGAWDAPCAFERLGKPFSGPEIIFLRAT
jgi:hypothetical protein